MLLQEQSWEYFILKLTVNMPAVKNYSDYDSFSFNIIFSANANDANPNYKNMFVFY